MRRRVTAVLLLLTLLWQSMAAAVPGGLFDQARDLTHTALHWLEEGHHHHDDGSYHQDDSADSVQHVIADAGLQASGLLASVWSGVAKLNSSSPIVTGDAFKPPPFIDGPHRPPRSVA